VKIATIIGARPQFIKAAVVSRAIADYNKRAGKAEIVEVIVHTGQHYDENMSDIFFEEMRIPRPDYHLGVGGGSHGAMTGRMLEAVEEVLLAETPDWVLVYGDTNSTLAGALAAVKLHIPIAHVEAGLRSFNRRMPEEINRVLSDHASDLLFAPTEAAVVNLQKEGIPDARVKLVGDVMYDAALYYGQKSAAKSRILKKLGLDPKSYVLATIHRAENTDDSARLKAIFEGLAQVASEFAVVLPLHPRTRAVLSKAGLEKLVQDRLMIIEPVGYLDMVALERCARMIVTDSGGVQKEAFFHKVPCVTLRDETEWVELVDLGWNRLIPPLSAEAVATGLKDGLRGTVGLDREPYGDGHSAEKIVQALLSQP